MQERRSGERVARRLGVEPERVDAGLVRSGADARQARIELVAEALLGEAHHAIAEAIEEVGSDRHVIDPLGGRRARAPRAVLAAVDPRLPVGHRSALFFFGVEAHEEGHPDRQGATGAEGRLFADHLIAPHREEEAVAAALRTTRLRRVERTAACIACERLLRPGGGGSHGASLTRERPMFMLISAGLPARPSHAGLPAQGERGEPASSAMVLRWTIGDAPSPVLR